MRIILLLLFLLPGLKTLAQITLAGTQWEIQEYYAAFEEIPAERIIYYTSDSNVEYTMHLEGLVYDFRADKVEMFYKNDFDQAGSQPVVYSGSNQVSINDVSYTIEEISEEYLKLVNVANYIGTPEENLLPIQTVFEFKKYTAVTSITEQIVDFHIAPNPVKDKISFTENVDNIQIIDFTGRLVYRGNVYGKSVDLSFLQVGNYILEVETRRGVRHTRIVKH